MPKLLLFNSLHSSHHLLLLQSGDTEINPGPMKSSRLNFCHWNLNAIAAHDFVKVTLIEAFIKANNIDIMCFPGTFLDSTIPLNDERLCIKGYLMTRADHPSNTKGVGVCICYEEYLPLIRKIDICILNEYIVNEVTVNNESCFLTCLYRSPNQNQEQFKFFCEKLIDVTSYIDNQQPTCSILVGDFNAKLSRWCPSAKDNKAGQDIDTFATTSDYIQMIGQPTHIINDKLSCIDLLLPLIANCSVMLESSKLLNYSKCHHNIPLIQLKRIKTFSPLNQRNVQT